MSDISTQGSHAFFALRRLDNKFTDQQNGINDFMESHANGENPDPALFSKLLEQRSVTHQAMQAQFKLHEKPLKTVLNETK
ncbi:MAG: hypothetical protein A3I66_12065 [Burkholderiales bacterium RIFCSPLOWO2_02_FULL_57_36]|nr:MAG: hypothetical protein A3I66_12065 [Burkholderiales bacterium RIFCSPLOWO2_02_FULL_57_36]